MPNFVNHTNESDQALRVFIPRDWKGLLLLAAGVVLLPLFIKTGYGLFLLNIMALNGLVVLGLNLLIGSTGQVSLGHAAFYGLGAYLSAIASTTWHWPLPAALAFALAVVAVVSLLLALPTLRLEGHYLVMATLGFNIIVVILFVQLEEFTGGPSGFPGIPGIRLGEFALNTDLRFYFLIWSVLLIFLALSLNLVDSRVGRALLAIHERQLTAEALGIPTQRYKVTTFVLSAIYAAVAGFCYAHYVTFISPKTFDIFYSVQIVTMVAVGGMGSLWGGLAGAVLLTALPQMLQHFEDLHVILYGLILMGVLVFCPQGLLPTLISMGRSVLVSGRKVPESPSRGIHQGGSRSPSRMDLVSSAVSSLTVPGPPRPPDRISPPLLTVNGVSVTFGGLQALNEVSLEVFPGEILALIGPNGAGKTTLLNTVCGIIQCRQGSVVLNGNPLTGLPPHAVAAHGVGRTFQAVQIYGHLSVLENVLLGFHLQGRCGFLSSFLHGPSERREEAGLRRDAMQLLESFQMADKAQIAVRELSLLEQKRLEIARALALAPQVLLLDEPAGGLNPRESLVLVQHLWQLREQGLGIILVEHDMNVVMQVADRIEVLQHGCRIASGTPGQIQSNPRVIEAYLGIKKFT